MHTEKLKGNFWVGCYECLDSIHRCYAIKNNAEITKKIQKRAAVVVVDYSIFYFLHYVLNVVYTGTVPGTRRVSTSTFVRTVVILLIPGTRVYLVLLQ